jgi:hypothetical protein
LNRFRLIKKEFLKQGFQAFGATPRTWRVIVFLSNLCHLYNSKFHEQTLVAAAVVAEVALI